VLDERVLVDDTVDVATGDVGADTVVEGLKLPELLLVEGRGVDATGDVDARRHLLDGLQGTLDAVEDVLHDTGAELDREGLASAEDRVTDGQTRY